MDISVFDNTATDPGVNAPQATNAAGWTASTYQYSATSSHAVTNVTPETGSPDTYEYDANGNPSTGSGRRMTCRPVSKRMLIMEYIRLIDLLFQHLPR